MCCSALEDRGASPCGLLPCLLLLTSQEVCTVWGAVQEDDLRHVSRKARRRPQVWQLIRENIYTHRAPKLQDEDDVMLCHCKLLPDGGPGCGPDCLNRVLNMECVPVSLW